MNRIKRGCDHLINVFIMVSLLSSVGCSDDAGPGITEVCPTELVTCQQGADEVCTSTDYDPDHCGACGNVCTATPQAFSACVTGTCVIAGCENDYGDCNNDIEADGCEIDLTATAEHCGACGVQCSATELCENGTCVEDPDQAARFFLKIASMDTSTCNAADHFAVTGGDRGGMAVGQGYFYYMGATSGARFDLDVAGLDPMPVTARHGIFSDLASDKLYAFTVNGVAATPGCDETIDGFIELAAADLSTVGAMIPLSAPIMWSCEDDASGVFSGRGQVVLHDSLRNTYAITLPDGEVTNLGTQVLLDNARTCANWALTGVAEFFDGDRHLVYRSDNPQAIVRHAVSTGNVETILDLNGVNVNNLCSVGADLTNNQWAWHYVGSGALDEIPGVFQVAGVCPATYDVP